MRTVIDVFSHDRPGLLYTIAGALHEMEVSVVMAKIATYFDQALDVFYVTDLKGNKITDGQWLKAIRERIERRLHEFERHGHKLFQ